MDAICREKYRGFMQTFNTWFPLADGYNIPNIYKVYKMLWAGGFQATGFKGVSLETMNPL